MPRAALLALLLVACARPKRPQCEAVIDRYVEFRLGDDPEITSAPESARAAVRETQRAKKKAEPAYTQRVDQCVDEVSARELDCGMKAPGPNEWESCFH